MAFFQYRNGKKLPVAAWLRAIGHWSFVIFLGILFMPAAGLSQSANRWLLIYNTSASMRDRVPGVEAVTQDLLTTAMHGNLRAGDTIGIWTYNDRLRADEAPLQTWSPQAAQSIIQNTVQFLSAHPYEKKAAFGDVLANMMRVVKMSDVITVILVSDGTDPISEIPFDDEVNAFYRANYENQKKAKMPVVTVYRGVKGFITTNTLALAPWPVDIPAVPPQAIVKAAPPKPATPPPPPVPSLVIIGKKAETTFKPASQLPDPTEEPASSAAPAASTTATMAEQAQEKPAAPKAQIAPVAPEPATTPKVEENPKASMPTVASTQPTTPPVAAETSKPVQPIPAAVPLVATPNETTSKAAAPATHPVAEAAAVEPAPNLLSVRNIAIASVGFTLLVCVLLLLAARNARNHASRVSLITRSLDREQQ